MSIRGAGRPTMREDKAKAWYAVTSPEWSGTDYLYTYGPQDCQRTFAGHEISVTRLDVTYAQGRAIRDAAGDGAEPYRPAHGAWDVFRILVVLDAYTLPMLDRWPVAVLAVTTANALFALTLWAAIVLGRWLWRASVRLAPLALFLLAVASFPVRFAFGRPTAPPKRKQRALWSRILRAGL